MTTLNKKRQKKRMLRKLIRLGMVIFPIVLVITLVSFLFNGKNNNKKEDINDTTSPVLEQDEIQEEEKEPEVITASILSAGDIIMHDPFLTSNYYKKADGSFDYNSIFRYIKQDYEAADFMVVNLESTNIGRQLQRIPEISGTCRHYYCTNAKPCEFLFVGKQSYI